MGGRSILITGTSGKLGSAFAQALKDQHTIVQLDYVPPHEPEQHEWGKVVVASTEDMTTLYEAMDDIDLVVHCGNIPSDVEPFDELIRVNTVGTFQILEAAGRRPNVKQFVFVSSVRYHGIFGEQEYGVKPLYVPFAEDHPTFATTPYACTKVNGETFCQAYARMYRKPVVAIRPSWIITLDQEPDFKARPAEDRLEFYEYVGTSDLIEALERIMDYDPPNGFDAFLLTSDDQYSTTPSVELAEKYMQDIRVDREKLSRCNGFGAFIDCTHAKEALGWQPRFFCKRD